jgi:hypothetical protein
VKRPRRPNVTPEEKAAALAAVLDIYADEDARAQPAKDAAGAQTRMTVSLDLPVEPTFL